MAGRRTGRVTSVPPTALTSGAKLLDFIPLPFPLFIAFRTIVFTVKHWYIAALALLYFSLGILPFLITFIAVPLSFYAYIYLSNPTYRRYPLTALRAAPRIAVARKRWYRAMEAATLTNGPHTPTLYSLKHPPRILNHDGTNIAFHISLFKTYKTVNHLENSQDYIVTALRARRSRIKRLTPGTAELTLEWDSTPIPTSIKQAKAIPSSSSSIVTTQLPTVKLDNGVYLELDTSLLVVGESGSGKSNLTWNILDGLNKYRIPYRLYVIDPKQVELAPLEHSPYTVKYVDRARDSEKVINAFHESMEETLSRMKATGTRSVKISQDNPLRILIIDELLLLGKQIKNGAVDTPFGEILSIGRAAAHIIIANSQLGQIDVIGRIRDLFPQRACLAVKSDDLTNATLGPRAEQKGARCTEITEKGTGYMYTDRSGMFQRFRPPFIQDVERVARGE